MNSIRLLLCIACGVHAVSLFTGYEDISEYERAKERGREHRQKKGRKAATISRQQEAKLDRQTTCQQQRTERETRRNLQSAQCSPSLEQPCQKISTVNPLTAVASPQVTGNKAHHRVDRQELDERLFQLLLTRSGRRARTTNSSADSDSSDSEIDIDAI